MHRRIELKGETDKSIIIVRGFSTSLLIIHRASRKQTDKTPVRIYKM